MKALISSALFLVIVAHVSQAATQNVSSSQSQSDGSVLDKIYSDESHCLKGPETRSDNDLPISCYCRDALADIHYLWQTYVVTGKDMNLTGVVFSLEIRAREVCGDRYDVLAAERKGWQWKGPEIMRTYARDSEIAKIKPDDRGWRTVRYEVRLTYRDPQGRVSKIKTFSAFETIPPDFRLSSASPGLYREQGYIVASAECPTQSGATVYERADTSSTVLGTIPRGTSIVITKPFLDTDQFYFVNGISSNETVAVAGYVLKDCVILKANSGVSHLSK